MYIDSKYWGKYLEKVIDKTWYSNSYKPMKLTLKCQILIKLIVLTYLTILLNIVFFLGSELEKCVNILFWRFCRTLSNTLSQGMMFVKKTLFKFQESHKDPLYKDIE